MKMLNSAMRNLVVMVAVSFGAAGVAQSVAVPASGMTILNRDQAVAAMPATVFFRGQSASIQGRNSAGVKIGADKLVLAAIVDTSGYSTAVQEKYQAYLLTEVPLRIGGHTLPPGAYGFGFVANDRLIVMDIGGHDLLTGTTTKDAALARPNPLQILANAGGAGVRLYIGRSYVTLEPLAESSPATK
jgi:hypothetical protein